MAFFLFFLLLLNVLMISILMMIMAFKIIDPESELDSIWYERERGFSFSKKIVSSIPYVAVIVLMPLLATVLIILLLSTFAHIDITAPSVNDSLLESLGILAYTVLDLALLAGINCLIEEDMDWGDLRTMLFNHAGIEINDDKSNCETNDSESTEKASA